MFRIKRYPIRQLIIYFALIVTVWADNNKTNIEKLHFGITGEYSRYLGIDAYLLSEYKFSDQDAFMLTAGSENIKKRQDSSHSKEVGISFIRYFGKQKFLFEGVHLNFSIAYEKRRSFFDKIHTYEGRDSSATIGYGWHFFNHTLLYMLHVGVFDDNLWNNRDFTSGYTRFTWQSKLAFIF